MPLSFRRLGALISSKDFIQEPTANCRGQLSKQKTAIATLRGGTNAELVNKAQLYPIRAGLICYRDIL